MPRKARASRLRGSRRSSDTEQGDDRLKVPPIPNDHDIPLVLEESKVSSPHPDGVTTIPGNDSGIGGSLSDGAPSKHPTTESVAPATSTKSALPSRKGSASLQGRKRRASGSLDYYESMQAKLLTSMSFSLIQELMQAKRDREFPQRSPSNATASPPCPDTEDTPTPEVKGKAGIVGLPPDSAPLKRTAAESQDLTEEEVALLLSCMSPAFREVQRRTKRQKT